jgi:DNA-binding HxlR family transcriptional regulator
MTELGAVERSRGPGFPGSANYELARPGRELIGVASAVRAWLAMGPDGTMELGGATAKNALKALVDGWSTSMLRALAARPLSLTELDRLIADISYPSLERRLAALRLTGLVRRMPGKGGGAPHAVTDWLRRAVAPLVTAARWEGAHARQTAAGVTNRDVEAAFLLSLPLLQLSSEAAGSCRFAVEFSNGSGHSYAGVVVRVEEGRIASCVSRLEGDAGAWASGSTADWIWAVAEQDPHRLEIGGEAQLAAGLLEGLHEALFPQLPAKPPSRR